MVLQRWQSVLLLFSVLLMGGYIAVPVAFIGSMPVHVWDNTAYLILNAAIAALLLIDIFLYSNLRLQMRVAAASMVLMAVSLGLGCVQAFAPGAEFAVWGIPMLFAALVMAWFARRFMARDRRLLAAADRLR